VNKNVNQNAEKLSPKTFGISEILKNGISSGKNRQSSWENGKSCSGKDIKHKMNSLNNGMPYPLRHLFYLKDFHLPEFLLQSG